MSVVVEPRLLGQAPPPVRHDRMVHAWIGAAAISWMGNAAWIVALSWVAVHTLSPAQAGLVISISTIPQALLTLPGGVIADRYDTRRILIAAQFAQAGVLLLGAAAWGMIPHLTLLLCAGIAEGIVMGLSAPAAATLGRQLVTSADLGTVAGWNQVAARLARLAGAPLGATLVAVASLPVVMIADALTFIVAGLALLLIVRPRYGLHGAVREPWLRSLGGGLAYLRRDRTALVFLLALCGLNVFAGPITGIGVPLRIADAGWPALTLGVAEAALSLCAIAGSLLAIRIRPAHPAKAAFAALIVQGAAYALVAVPNPITLIAAMAVIGLTAGCASVWLSALFVRVVDPAYLGRVASLSNLGDLLLVPAALPLFGLVTAHVGIGVSPLIVAALMVAMCSGILARTDIRSIGAAAPRTDASD